MAGEQGMRANHARLLFFLWILVVAPVGHSVAAASGSDLADARPVKTVGRVDLERYAGLWHEVARIPNRFQKKCAYGTTAEYTLREDGRITVVNRCHETDGDLSEAKGVAKSAGGASNAKLEVSFVSFLGWRPFWGEYWVIGLDDDYRWAIVGHPERTYGWVLAREPTLDDATMETIWGILERNGYEREQFEPSPPAG
jgi:apolipoprotein D and lipocalin family protein